MLCQRCKKNQATVSCVEEINGKKIGYNLCRECYTEMFGSFSSAVNNDILAGLFGQPAKRHARICPVCGTVYSDFERTGLLGCASCYDVFKEELMPYIERIQGRVVHVGKVARTRANRTSRANFRACRRSLNSPCAKGGMPTRSALILKYPKCASA